MFGEWTGALAAGRSRDLRAGCVRFRRRGTARLAAGLIAAALTAAAGCQHADRAAYEWTARQRALARTIDTLSEHERILPARLERNLRFVQERLELDARRMQKNAGKLADWAAGDIERFERRQPEYRREVERRLDGKPERIELTAILLFL